MKGTKMTELKCNDGTVIKISDETEAELRRAFRPKPNYKDFALQVHIDTDEYWPIVIKVAKDCTLGKDYVVRNVKDTKVFIVALQQAIAYCEKHDLGI